MAHPFAAPQQPSISITRLSLNQAPAPKTSRPSLTKRHTAPSPASLLQLPTLEALPPTPSSSTRVRRSTSSSLLSYRPTTPLGVATDMHLLRLRSRRPNSPREQTSFLPFDIPPVVINAFGFHASSENSSSRPQSSSHGSRSQGPPSDYYQPDERFVSPFSHSSPPSLSKATSNLHALPSIDGVIEELYALPSPSIHQSHSHSSSRSPSRPVERRNSATVKAKRETLKLPLMAPPATRPPPAIRDDEPLNMDDWEWEAFGPIGRSSASAKPSAARPSSPTTPMPRHQQPRDTRLTNAQSQDFHPSRAGSYRSIPSRAPSTHRSLQSQPQSLWTDGNEEEPDELEIKAMEVLEHFNGHLLRDAWGYGTGLNVQPIQQATSNSASASSVHLSSRSVLTANSIDRTQSQSSAGDEMGSRPTTSSSEHEKNSMRSWRDARKKPKVSPISPASDEAHAHTSQMTEGRGRRAPPPPPLSHTRAQHPGSSDELGAIGADTSTSMRTRDVNTNDLALEAGVQALNNRLSYQDRHEKQGRVEPPPPPIPPRSTQRLSAPLVGLGQKDKKPPSGEVRSRHSSTSLQSRDSRRKVPAVLNTSRHDINESVCVIDTCDFLDQFVHLPPIQQRPLPPLPTNQLPLPRTSSTQPRLAARILRPKRPTTAPSSPPPPFSAAAYPDNLVANALILTKQKLTPPKLVPRDERESARRYSGKDLAASHLSNASIRHRGMSALSFLAIDDLSAAVGMTGVASPEHREKGAQKTKNGSSEAKSTQRRRATSFGSVSISNQAHHYSAVGQGGRDSPGPAYIIPPSERSKIGVEDRRERRRCRRGSHSSLSSVAGSEVSDLDFEVVQRLANQNKDQEDQWSLALSFNNVQSRERDRAHRALNINTSISPVGHYDYASRRQFYPNPLSPPPRQKKGRDSVPLPLHLSPSPGRRGRREYIIEMDARTVPETPRTPGLLPPPRPKPRARAVTAAAAVKSINEVRLDGDIRASERQSQAASSSTAVTTPTAVLITPLHRRGTSDGLQQEFMDVYSPSPSPATPHPPHSSHHTQTHTHTTDETHAGLSSSPESPNKHRITRDLYNPSDLDSTSDLDDTGSTPDLEREERTKDWLACQPHSGMGMMHVDEGLSGMGPMGEGMRDHPFFVRYAA